MLFDSAVAHHSSFTSLDVEQQMILLLSSRNSTSVSKFVHSCLLNDVLFSGLALIVSKPFIHSLVEGGVAMVVASAGLVG